MKKVLDVDDDTHLRSDLIEIPLLFNKRMDIIVIIAFISTQMLLFLLRTLDYNRNNQIIRLSIDCHFHLNLRFLL